MDAFELSDLDRERVEAGKLYLEFLRTPALSLGLYVLPAGGVDAQQPHKEEEVYYVVSGRAMVRVDDEDRSVQPGSIIFSSRTAASVSFHHGGLAAGRLLRASGGNGERGRQATEVTPWRRSSM